MVCMDERSLDLFCPIAPFYLELLLLGVRHRSRWGKRVTAERRKYDMRPRERKEGWRQKQYVVQLFLYDGGRLRVGQVGARGGDQQWT